MARSAMSLRTYYILAALLESRLHGYGIISAVERLSGGEVRLAAGTLYGVLDRLTTQGLVEVAGEEVVAGRFRRYYRITSSGAEAVREEAARLRRAARAVRPRTKARTA